MRITHGNGMGVFFIVVGLALVLIPTPEWITAPTALRMLTSAVYLVGGWIVLEIRGLK